MYSRSLSNTYSHNKNKFFTSPFLTHLLHRNVKILFYTPMIKLLQEKRPVKNILCLSKNHPEWTVTLLTQNSYFYPWRLVRKLPPVFRCGLNGSFDKIEQRKIRVGSRNQSLVVQEVLLLFLQHTVTTWFLRLVPEKSNTKFSLILGNNLCMKPTSQAPKSVLIRSGRFDGLSRVYQKRSKKHDVEIRTIHV